MKMANPEPLVCAIMLTRDRPAMARRAVEAFRAQTYASKRLVLLSSGFHQLPFPEFPIHLVMTPGKTIGHLRNLAIEFVCDRGAPGDCPEIVVHWDDDDWSHPNRIAEQVALLQSSGADIVGYREMLFWDNRKCADVFDGGLAWLYSHPHPSYCLGTSLCYWRRTWEARKFRDISNGEEHWFCEGRKCIGASSLVEHPSESKDFEPRAIQPRMIATIHGANTGPNYDIDALIARGSREWKRVPEWDDYCRRAMTL